MVKYYLKSKNAVHLLNEIDVFPKEHVCIFRAQKPNEDKIRQLSDIIRNDVTLLPTWLVDSQFDEWDDW